MTLQEYYDLLERHDWFYDWMNQNSWQWQRGKKEWEHIMKIAKSGPEYEKLRQAWYDHVFSGEDFDRPKQPKPERPNENEN